MKTAALYCAILLACLTAIGEIRVHYWEDDNPTGAVGFLYWSTNQLSPDSQWKLIAQGGIEVGSSNKTRFKVHLTDLPPGVHYIFGRQSNQFGLSAPSNVSAFTNATSPQGAQQNGTLKTLDILIGGVTYQLTNGVLTVKP